MLVQLDKLFEQSFKCVSIVSTCIYLELNKITTRAEGCMCILPVLPDTDRLQRRSRNH